MDEDALNDAIRYAAELDELEGIEQATLNEQGLERTDLETGTPSVGAILGIVDASNDRHHTGHPIQEWGPVLAARPELHTWLANTYRLLNEYHYDECFEVKMLREENDEYYEMPANLRQIIREAYEAYRNITLKEQPPVATR
ncbi:hypothetical protein [Bifidobacterium olomucense]|uniref:Uncharacterized protein n=1 Tax=Bifidobacterium olomucense TaxID=2675324 RepID=A0A7Y0EY69_9BIFI|nr:hypothetical protein [Bifidobacterium sp. DSM 109959]NMM97511.1 hypothetical protein [Bifidobacterium sp. DSM 109959]